MVDWNLIQQIGSIAGGVISTVAIMTWWLSGQFGKMREYTESVYDKIVSKLEYHERHDDRRFAEIKDDLWEIRLQNAAREARAETIRKALDRNAKNIEKDKELDDSGR